MIKSAPSSDQRTRYNKAFSFRKLFWAMTAGSDNGTGEVEVISLPLRNAWGEKWSLQLKSNICQVLKLKPYPTLLFLHNHINAFLGVGHLWSLLWILGTRSLSFRWAFFKNVNCWQMSSWHFYYLTQLPFIGNFQSCGKVRGDSEWIIIEAIVRCWLCWTCWKPLVSRDPFKVRKQMRCWIMLK